MSALDRLRPGAVLRHREGGAVMLDSPRADGGWHVLGGGGLAPFALASGDWFFVAESLTDLVIRFERAVLSDIEARNPEIDPDEVQRHRDRVASLVLDGEGPI